MVLNFNILTMIASRNGLSNQVNAKRIGVFVQMEAQVADEFWRDLDEAEALLIDLKQMRSLLTRHINVNAAKVEHLNKKWDAVVKSAPLTKVKEK